MIFAPLKNKTLCSDIKSQIHLTEIAWIISTQL